jgi:purine catabolism regulator
MITLGDIITNVLPAEAENGLAPSMLAREVTWVTRPRPSPPAFAHLNGGELVLLRQEDLQDVDDRLTLDVALRQLAGFGVSAVAFAGAITSEDRSLARDRDVALIGLGKDVDLVSIERQASLVISERRRERQRRGQESGRRLMELAIAGEPLATIINTLAEVTGQAVALEGRDGKVLTYFSQNGYPAREDVDPLLDATRGVVQNWLSVTSDASPAEPPTMHMALGGDLDRTVAPVIGRDGLLGCLSLIGPTSAWSGDDGLITSRGAAACAIVLAREFASIAARREIELNVLDEVLDGALRNEATLLQQGRRLGHDLTGQNRMLVCSVSPLVASAIRNEISQALGNRNLNLLWRIKDEQIEIVLPGGVEAANVLRAIKREVPGNPMRAAIGQSHEGLAGLQRSRREACQALLIQERLRLEDEIAEFDRLGIYRLLFAAESLPESSEFHRATLGELLDHDAQHHADLVPTLRAWFNANGSPKVAAERLGVHRNTVLYRLSRIAALSGYDLDDADTRLRLQLALAIDTISSSGRSLNGVVV